MSYSESPLQGSDAVTRRSDAVHKVVNRGAKLSVSLPVYGRNVCFAKRSHFDVGKNREIPGLIEQF
jgi:hypothetical protein